jgi:hypothetical protein
MIEILIYLVIRGGFIKMTRNKFYKKNGKPYKNNPNGNYKAGTGAPTKFKKSFYKRAYIAFVTGSTDKDFANSIKVTTETLADWQRTKKPFSYVITYAKVIYDSTVMENSMKRSANGHFLTEVREVLDRTGDKVELKTVKEVSPNIHAINRWLAVRHKKEWAEQDKNININSKETKTLEINLSSDLKEEAIAEAIRILIKSGAVKSGLSTQVH